MRADHRPGVVDAVGTLRRVRERNPDVPFLLCTATGSEELAVAAMKFGFDDYVLKHPHHFPRLVPAVRSALEDSERRRLGREVESRYRSLFEGVPVGLYRASLSGQILDANHALIQLLGFPSRESLVAANLSDIHADPTARRAFPAPHSPDGSGPRFIPAPGLWVFGGTVGKFALYGGLQVKSWDENTVDYRHYRTRKDIGGLVHHPEQARRIVDSSVTEV